jgi:hypothetical protein
VGIFAQRLAVLVSWRVAGHKPPRPFWMPDVSLEIQGEVEAPQQRLPTPIPKSRSP